MYVFGIKPADGECNCGKRVRRKLDKNDVSDLLILKGKYRMKDKRNKDVQ